jgi:hypothetical protein
VSKSRMHSFASTTQTRLRDAVVRKRATLHMPLIIHRQLRLGMETWIIVHHIFYTVWKELKYETWYTPKMRQVATTLESSQLASIPNSWITQLSCSKSPNFLDFNRIFIYVTVKPASPPLFNFSSGKTRSTFWNVAKVACVSKRAKIYDTRENLLHPLS